MVFLALSGSIEVLGYENRMLLFRILLVSCKTYGISLLASKGVC